MKIQNVWLNSILRFTVFQLFLLIILTVAINVVGKYSRETQADSIGSSIRNSFLIGDNRTVVKALNGSLHTGYIFIESIDQRNITLFKIGNDEDINDIFVKKYTFEIYSNPVDKSSLSGKILFYYDIKNFIINSLLIWLFFLIFSSPVLLLEKRRLETKYLEEIRNQELRTVTMLAEQVSHDIRSPLAVLQSIAEESIGFAGEEAIMLKRAINRIEIIANDLLSVQKKNQIYEIGNSNSNKLESLNTQLEILVKEKKLQFKNRDNIEIQFESINNHLLINMNQVDFYRSISNIINNSLEAIEGTGLISISLTMNKGEAVIQIKDNGKGIPNHIIDKIGERGFTFEKNIKNSGTGLGIYYARNVIESLNGRFIIQSELSKGTSIIITLPVIVSSYESILIDDDELVRIIWNNAAKKAGINFLSLSSIQEFNKISYQLNKKFTKIYIDSELKDEIKGEEFAKLLYEEKFENLYIATGHPPEKFLDKPWLKYSTKKCPF